MAKAFTAACTPTSSCSTASGHSSTGAVRRQPSEQRRRCRRGPARRRSALPFARDAGHRGPATERRVWHQVAPRQRAELTASPTARVTRRLLGYCLLEADEEDDERTRTGSDRRAARGRRAGRGTRSAALKRPGCPTRRRRRESSSPSREAPDDGRPRRGRWSGQPAGNGATAAEQAAAHAHRDRRSARISSHLPIRDRPRMPSFFACS